MNRVQCSPNSYTTTIYQNIYITLYQHIIFINFGYFWPKWCPESVSSWRTMYFHILVFSERNYLPTFSNFLYFWSGKCDFCTFLCVLGRNRNARSFGNCFFIRLDVLITQEAYFAYPKKYVFLTNVVVKKKEHVFNFFFFLPKKGLSDQL